MAVVGRMVPSYSRRGCDAARRAPARGDITERSY